MHPDWVAGISIGAINSAIIAGNPPKRRVNALREFWHAVSTSPLGSEPQGCSRSVALQQAYGACAPARKSLPAIAMSRNLLQNPAGEQLVSKSLQYQNLK
jgi:predicted acylesterase/phospholipase RssA